MEKIAFTAAILGALAYFAALMWAGARRSPTATSLEAAIGVGGFALLWVGLAVGIICRIWS